MKKEKFNPWPYGLAVVLIAFCVIQLSLVTLASRNFQGLEDVEYYRHGVEYGKEIERQEKQQDLEWTVAHNLEQALKPTDRFPLRIALLDSDEKPIMHAKLRIKVGRTATKEEDLVYELKEVGPGIYACKIRLGLGNWKVNIEADKGENLVKVEFRHRVGRGAAPPGPAAPSSAPPMSLNSSVPIQAEQEKL